MRPLAQTNGCSSVMNKLETVVLGVSRITREKEEEFDPTPRTLK